MSISFTGLASGLPVNDIIDQLMAIERRPIDMLENKKQELELSRSYFDNVETRVKSLGTAIQKFTDGNIATSMDLFKQKEATSSNESVMTVTAGSKAVNQTFDVNILSIATSTKAESLGSASTTGDVGALVTGTTAVTSLANGTGTEGTFTVYYDDVPYEITINAGDDVNTVLGNITTATGGNITASITGGIITLASAGGTINVGANGDTSNFLAATQLDVGTYVGNDLNSANALSAINTAGTLTDNSVNMQTAVTAGTFTIGSATFTIDASTTLDSLINEINADADAGVSATYNLRTNKIELQAKDPGQVAITLQDNGSNFLQAVNLITGTGDTLAYQTLGNNAQFQINGGPTIESTSNTVTEAVTGIKDVTLTFLSDSGGSNVTATIQQDSDAIVAAVEDFVSEFNKVISYIDEQTDPDTGNLPGDTTLLRLRNNLRTQVTDMVSNSPLVSMASVGITTGDVGTEGDPQSTLVFDKDVFLDALSNNLEDVRALFIGDTTASITGVMEDLESYTDAALDPVNGLFFAKDEAIDNQLSDLDKSILRAQERLEAKEKLLKAQFSAMEAAISQLNSQQQYINGQLGATK